MATAGTAGGCGGLHRRLLLLCCVIGCWLVDRASSAGTTDPRGMIGPSVLHSDSQDEDIIVSSGQGWGSGSGHLAFENYDQEGDDEEDIPSTKATLLKLVTPDSTRMSCIICTTVGDQSCRDPYVRNASHVQACQTSVEGCLKVVTPSGDTYRNCLYGIFATAEQMTGCRVVKEDIHIGHKFVNATICVCRTNECNGLSFTSPSPTSKTISKAPPASVVKTFLPTNKPSLILYQPNGSTSPTAATTTAAATTPKSSVSALKYSNCVVATVVAFLFSVTHILR
ncbi:hypothetical protein BV898_13091 [Hypsibius exemplaris]|uniref:UPAR/Ly6 domain-containing protein n=1 Tax=Hypsibius exemplaris TaxID=2072580 RepID=A0A1W0WC00_HYPEX|nr:hypothetical protein BV898_13091 [Hypsibius exemplaris]